jgi:hypothetical protein
MNHADESVWPRLFEAGLVEGPAPETTNLPTPWYVKALMAFCGWLAAWFLLGFIGMGLAFVIKSSLASLITGALMIGGAYALLRMPKNEFVEHLVLAASLAGQILMGWAIFRFLEGNLTMIWVLLGLLQALLAVVMPNFIHRVFSAYFSSIALAGALTYQGMPYLFSGILMFAVAWIWLNEFRYPKHQEKIRAIGYGLTLALIQLKATMLLGYSKIYWQLARKQPELWIPPEIGELIAGAAMLYVVWQLLQRGKKTLSASFAITVLISTLLLCFVSLEAQGIAAAMVIILTGFAGGNRVLQGLGIASLLFFISSYYYLLDATLLVKAQTLLIIGLVMLIGRWFMIRNMFEEKDANHV